MKRSTVVCATAFLLTLGPGLVWGQSFEERLERVRQQRMAEQARAARAMAEAGVQQEDLRIEEKLRVVLRQVNFEEVTARQALDWWSRTTQVPLVINWAAMELQGISAETPVSITLDHVPANQLLHLILKLVAPDVPMIVETTPWYVQIMTKEQANEIRVVRIYEVNDMLMRIPNFKGPQFDLENALDSSRTGSGSGRSGSGSGSSSGGRLFQEDEDQNREPEPTKKERGEELVRLIQDTIEPEVWDTYGGSSSIRYYEGKLIVNAPMYVHRQIGMPTVGGRRSADVPAGSTRQRVVPTPRTPAQRNPAPARTPGVSAVRER